MEPVIAVGLLLMGASLIFYALLERPRTKCFKSHDWTKWDQPIQVKSFFYDLKSGKEVPYTEKIQSRLCNRCGIIQEYVIHKMESV